ncbi:MBL fold metallo-hydrolase [Pseudomonas sp. Leaf127]|uniref:MBL fold metallo-hydrolase RNA specificity domain-containing protein n=1 Tax=Pseudomonas sp. Leaf127 TaxID=1736267 RepID=UPI0007035F5B|nr:MBL fold metallo-hydrolase [Pseudomonas sp. Leaf127]KQQ56910.1 MBL fold metallo-hydrolase [Pseudomonas sp. Leaf127]
MQYPHILHHGATERVTGSCHQLFMDPHTSVLIDCGADHDVSSPNVLNVSPATLKALIITHVHNDHVGRLHELLASGFKGPILCSEASARLLPLVMEDVLKQGRAHDSQQTKRVLETIRRKIVALPFERWFTMVDTPLLQCRLRLQRAGHILGSAYVEFDLQYPESGHDARIVFSGDLGACHTPILRRPRSPERADILVLESTYGDRLHADRTQRQARLEQVIDQALKNGGSVLLPAFSIGRTQELLYELEDILRRKALLSPAAAQPRPDQAPVDWAQLPVILDSPLASRFTRVYRAFHADWDAQAQQRLDEGRTPLGFDQLITVDGHVKHMQVVNYLAKTARPAIVIAGHGMCSGGRIVNYLKAMLGDPRHHVVFVGYQAKGTPGRMIQVQGRASQPAQVELDGAFYAIRAGVTTVAGYSAHADQQGLVSFVTGMAHWPGQIRLVHGEHAAKTALGQALVSVYRQHDKALHLLIPGMREQSQRL